MERHRKIPIPPNRWRKHNTKPSQITKTPNISHIAIHGRTRRRIYHKVDRNIKVNNIRAQPRHPHPLIIPVSTAEQHGRIGRRLVSPRRLQSPTPHRRRRHIRPTPARQLPTSRYHHQIPRRTHRRHRQARHRIPTDRDSLQRCQTRRATPIQTHLPHPHQPITTPRYQTPRRRVIRQRRHRAPVRPRHHHRTQTRRIIVQQHNPQVP